jgi:hypothetical protein
MLVPEGGDEGADKELPCVDVAQDLDPSPEGPKAILPIEGKPRIINPVFQNYAICLLRLCIYVSGVVLKR